MTTANHNNLINILAFQVIWWAGVLAGNQLILIPALLVVWHFVVSPQKVIDAKVMFSVVVIGVLSDSLLAAVGIFEFTQLPIWLLLLWGYFAISLNYSLSLFNALPVAIQALLGGIFGSLSYIGGANLGAVSLPYGTAFTSGVLFLIWCLLFPLCLKISLVIRSKQPIKETGQYI
ncbi:DUF2878 domain-containing protein [Shewanella donghaensis]|uniref:DUF2878 domain-containing protein n=1 Tax=Shewanella donghaensis TaxID=238836 RepID=UPI0011838FDC|nr:DUF2878 domain-containing protein [Shewanella donghaensis]